MDPSVVTASNRLTSFFHTAQPRVTRFEDAEIEEIANLLEQCGHVGRKCPRTYIILRIIGEIDLLERLLDEGFSDEWFPVESRGLPNFLDPLTKTKFAQYQDLILTKSFDLEHGKHKHFGRGEGLPFDVLGRLGSGGYGQVDRIRSKTSFRQYALKRIRRRAVFGNNSKEAMKQFLDEIRIVKGLKHHHIIQYIGSYTDKTFLGLIMTPVAHFDLAAYLEHVCVHVQAALEKTASYSDQRLRTEKCSTLRSYFGCLAAALAYLHDRSIRHKDIKPQNILVHNGNVILTDFGLSRDFTGEVGSTTTGLTPASPRYKSPEVAAYDSRNTSADIWSLGCVYLEMAAALHGLNVDWLKSYFQESYTMSPHYYANPEALQRLLSEWYSGWDLRDRKIVEWIRKMCQPERYARPNASQVMGQIRIPDDIDPGATTFCGICCTSDDVTDSEDSLDAQKIDLDAFARDLENSLPSKQDLRIPHRPVTTGQSAKSDEVKTRLQTEAYRLKALGEETMKDYLERWERLKRTDSVERMRRVHRQREEQERERQKKLMDEKKHEQSPYRVRRKERKAMQTPDHTKVKEGFTFTITDLEKLERVRQSIRCFMSDEFQKIPGGWRCAGGAHVISDADFDAAFQG